jgi:hypothetical protein
MIQVASFLLSFRMMDAELSIANDGWDLTPAVTFIAVILIIGFAVIAAGWTIKRDV